MAQPKPTLAINYIRRRSCCIVPSHLSLTSVLLYIVPQGRVEYEGLVAEDAEAVEESLDMGELPVRLVGQSQAIQNYGGDSNSGNLTQRLTDIERQMLLDALESHDWGQTKAAERRASAMQILCYKMKKEDIQKTKK